MHHCEKLADVDVPPFSQALVPAEGVYNFIQR